jgi:hypothetical protein
MRKIAEIPDINSGTILHISYRKYPKYKKERDREEDCVIPIEVYALATSANALLRRGFFTRDWQRHLYVLTNMGFEYIKRLILEQEQTE